MNKITLSEIDLYYGEVKMPKGFEIDRKKLTEDILSSTTNNLPFPFSKTWSILNTYLIEHFNLNYNIHLVNKETWGNVYNSKELSLPLKQTDPVDLKNSPDYVLLYGVKIAKKSCTIKIFYDDNRRKGRSWDIPIENNQFIMFPSTQLYCVLPNRSDESNFLQTINYEYI